MCIRDRDKFPEIKKMCRVVAWTDGEIWIDNILYNENKLLVTDPNFFTFFTFPLKVGDAATVFEAPDNIVLSESAASKYFPGEDPIGKTLRYGGQNFKVTGIMYDMPCLLYTSFSS